MATTRHDTVVTRWALDHPVHDLFPGLPRQKGKRRSCGEGAHGRRIYDWARVEVGPWHRQDRRHWVLARRSVSRPEEISYYIAYCPADTTLDELIRIAGSRWAVEECVQTGQTVYTRFRRYAIDGVFHPRPAADPGPGRRRR